MGSYLLSHLHMFGGGILGYVVPFVFVLSLVVFFHELGHFLIARWCGVQILTFSIGFGPEIVGFNDRYGTRWKFSAIPLGGFVKFFGDENVTSAPSGESAANMDADQRARTFMFQPLLKRTAIVVAGPVANFVLAVIIFAGVFTLYGKQTMSARVDSVQPGSAAAAAGFEPGDLVLAIDGRAISSFGDMQRIVSTSAGETLSITVEHDGVKRELKATPALKEVKDNFGNVQRIGILGITRSMAAEDLKLHPVAPPKAIWMSSAGDVVRYRPHAQLYRRGAQRAGSRQPTRRPDSDCADVGTGCQLRIRSANSVGGSSFGVDRAAEPLPDTAARWRSPFVLCNRRHPRASALGSGPGSRLSHWSRNRADVDDICNFQ